MSYRLSISNIRSLMTIAIVIEDGKTGDDMATPVQKMLTNIIRLKRRRYKEMFDADAPPDTIVGGIQSVRDRHPQLYMMSAAYLLYSLTFAGVIGCVYYVFDVTLSETQYMQGIVLVALVGSVVLGTLYTSRLLSACQGTNRTTQAGLIATAVGLLGLGLIPSSQGWLILIGALLGGSGTGVVSTMFNTVYSAQGEDDERGLTLGLQGSVKGLGICIAPILYACLFSIHSGVVVYILLALCCISACVLLDPAMEIPEDTPTPTFELYKVYLSSAEMAEIGNTTPIPGSPGSFTSPVPFSGGVYGGSFVYDGDELSESSTRDDDEDEDSEGAMPHETEQEYAVRSYRASVYKKNKYYPDHLRLPYKRYTFKEVVTVRIMVERMKTKLAKQKLAALRSSAPSLSTPTATPVNTAVKRDTPTTVKRDASLDRTHRSNSSSSESVHLLGDIMI
ncbi:major facilitator superfamily protein [Kipferlia bialata]|uniref:Major facilitator superfamily protein n=1 Tax=Kipferlia bialata TaxID=797122 RepID=A0A9K3CYK4_9EUKA|nr:major facilitator superfamily protein [Kipferlia bialata]|eukprot:g6439.t1